jgi:hypothetical protein
MSDEKTPTEKPTLRAKLLFPNNRAAPAANFFACGDRVSPRADVKCCCVYVLHDVHMLNLQVFYDHSKAQ